MRTVTVDGLEKQYRVQLAFRAFGLIAYGQWLARVSK